MNIELEAVRDVSGIDEGTLTLLQDKTLIMRRIARGHGIRIVKQN